MAKVITLSFKDTELELYEYVKSKTSPSAYIKELIQKDTSGIKIDEPQKKTKDEESKKSPSINLSALKGVGR